MLKETVSEMVLTLVLISLILVFNVQPVKAEPATIIVPDDYLTIQEAINHANEGDTIFVKSGTYYQHVVVNKSLSLIGADKFNTIIDGGVETFYPLLKSYSISISGFTVQNGGILTGESVFYSSYVTISSNIIDGVVLSGDATVTDNDINGGILMRFHGGNTISRNDIRGGGGIRQEYGEGGWNTIVGNNVTDSDGDGIFLAENSFDIIQGNNITNSEWNGISVISAFECTIIGNLIEENSECGISLSKISNCSIVDNNIARNGLGISLSAYDSRNKVYHNNFLDNTEQATCGGGDFPTNWDNDYPSGGNYWSDYIGDDIKRGQYQDEPGSDGIGDVPYVINADNQDNYPLMQQFTSRPWDINRDGYSNAKDAVILGTHFGTQHDMAGYLWTADINLDGYINAKDAVILGVHFAEHW